MAHRRFRDIGISVFVAAWILIFHYESIRYFYLEPLFSRPLPQMKFLFPPAGWIMFFNVDDSFAYAEVYGVRGGPDGLPETLQRIDPHEILRTRAIGYDNIHRNVLSVVLEPQLKGPFCSFLRRAFPGFDSFVVAEGYYPSLTRAPHLKFEKEAYRCPL